jgi:hypothetical protein
VSPEAFTKLQNELKDLKDLASKLSAVPPAPSSRPRTVVDFELSDKVQEQVQKREYVQLRDLLVDPHRKKLSKVELQDGAFTSVLLPCLRTCSGSARSFALCK